MEEQNGKHAHAGGACGDLWCGKKYSTVRILVALAVVVFVFIAGVRLGEFKGRSIQRHARGGYHMSQFGHGRFGGRDTMFRSGSNQFYGPGMMTWTEKTAPVAPTVPAKSATQ